MEELFKGSNADGSLAMDQETCLDDDKDCDSDDSRGLNDISGYAHPADHADDDSDTLPSPEAKQISPNYAASGENSSSSTHRSGKKRSRGYKSPSKKPLKSKSRFSDATLEIATTIKEISKSLAEPPPPPPVLKFDNPHAELWKRLEALTICIEDKIKVGTYLARPENEVSVTLFCFFCYRTWMCLSARFLDVLISKDSLKWSIATHDRRLDAFMYDITITLGLAAAAETYPPPACNPLAGGDGGT
ncbi:hypothetical protein HU200_058848 [Digitaria exilis]|uniref:Uncharacterized protein n=1 Tax=Digitaria exilis TaxID=1010633 RepID=A0A835ADB5_9POAL|nr:hypothetical protein HU200_058848 [Digitaria exilis]